MGWSSKAITAQLQYEVSSILITKVIYRHNCFGGLTYVLYMSGRNGERADLCDWQLQGGATIHIIGISNNSLYESILYNSCYYII